METKKTNEPTATYTSDKMEALFQSFKHMISVETVVGEAVHIGDTTLVPFVDVAFEKLLNMVPEIIDKMRKDKFIYIKEDEELHP